MGIGNSPTPEEIPNRLIVRNCGLTLDGGTIHLFATDETGREFGIMLVTLSDPGATRGVAGRLYFGGVLVPMRSERETRILELLTEATVQVAPLPSSRRPAKMAILGEDIEKFIGQSPEENCRAYIRKIVESVRAESYSLLATDEEKAVAKEILRDDWEPRTAKKKRRNWGRRRE